MPEYQKRWWVMVGVGLASIIGCIDFTIVNTALPAMQRSLSLSFTQLQWIMNVFIFMLPVFMVIGGRLGDIYGHRKVLYIAVILFGITSLGAGFSNSITPLLICRGLQGIAGALMWPNAAAVVMHAFPEEEQGRSLSILYSIYGLGLAIGPFIGGVLVEFLNWRWIFLINVPVIIISFIICLSSVKESLAAVKEKLDYIGVLLMAIGLGGMTIAIVEGNNLSWSSPITLSLFIVGIIVFAFWSWHEKRAAHPTLNFRLFNQRNIIASLIGSMVLGAFYALGFFLMPLYLDNILHIRPFITGSMLLATSLLLAIISPFMGPIIDRYSVKYFIVGGLLLFAATAAMQMFFGLHTSFTYIIISFALFGIAWGLIGAPLMGALIQGLPRDASGVATGSLWTVQNAGAVIGLAVGTAIFQFAAGSKISTHVNPAPFLKGYSSAMGFLLTISLIVAVYVTIAMRNNGKWEV